MIKFKKTIGLLLLCLGLTALSIFVIMLSFAIHTIFGIVMICAFLSLLGGWLYF